jgi:hypothetical protein
MKARIRYDHWFPKLIRRRGIVLYPFVLISFSEPEALRTRILHHEWIHIRQIRRDGYLRFYCVWLGQLVKNLFRYKNYDKAYRNISYEVEAYKKMRLIKLPKVLE